MSRSNFTSTEHTVLGQHIRHYLRSSSLSQEDKFHLHVKQYTPHSSTPPHEGDLTLLACHASGFPKEPYEPFWDDLLSIITVEPIINKTTEGMHFGGLYPITFKKDKWPSHEAAARSILKSTLYKSWDPRIRELYMKHGFRSLPTKHQPAEEGVKAVTTTTTKAQEILSFGKGAYPPNQKGLSLDEWTPDPLRHPDLGEWRDKGNAFYRPEPIITFAQLPHLRPSVLYVVGDRSPKYSSSPSGRADVLAATGTGVGGSGGVAKGLAAEAIVEGGSHLLVMEQPTHMAEEIVGPRIGEEMKKWAETERRELAEWENWEESKRGQIDPDWEWWMKERHCPKGPKNMDKKAKL